jgi:hypothetical protein
MRKNSLNFDVFFSDLIKSWLATVYICSMAGAGAGAAFKFLSEPHKNCLAPQTLFRL